MRKKTEGAIIRSRARWTEFGEKNTKYFLNLEKRQQQRNVIKELQTTKNTLKNSKLILKKLTSFYKQLYSDANDVPTNDMINYIDSMNLPNITLLQRKSCEEVITARECEIAMQELTSNRAPGLDGIPIEFYKTFWGDIKDIFLDSIIFAHETGQLCESQYQGVITLIPKPEKELLQITN